MSIQINLKQVKAKTKKEETYKDFFRQGALTIPLGSCISSSKVISCFWAARISAVRTSNRATSWTGTDGTGQVTDAKTAI
jgi:hypothetical protein